MKKGASSSWLLASSFSNVRNFVMALALPTLKRFVNEFENPS